MNNKTLSVVMIIAAIINMMGIIISSNRYSEAEKLIELANMRIQGNERIYEIAKEAIEAERMACRIQNKKPISTSIDPGFGDPHPEWHK